MLGDSTLQKVTSFGSADAAAIETKANQVVILKLAVEKLESKCRYCNTYNTDRCVAAIALCDIEAGTTFDVVQSPIKPKSGHDTPRSSARLSRSGTSQALRSPTKDSTGTHQAQAHGSQKAGDKRKDRLSDSSIIEVATQPSTSPRLHSPKKKDIGKR